ncbi:MAG: Haloacid dehalogenase domain protein hydrolase [Verrucomicrobiales bacterium]|nr:Haloacid dehalogenase domain protein hydrolase [Verrucomicrobiales bacterium]
MPFLPFTPPPPVRAVILDVYHTLLHVTPGPPDASQCWEALWRDCFPSGDSTGMARPSLEEFNAACRRETALDHACKKAAGIQFPEVEWRDIARRAAPALAALNGMNRMDGFLLAHAALERSCAVMPGALEFLQTAWKRGLLLGIASNAQLYTLGELRNAGVPLGMFDPELCFWSWREGFSKPDTGVFKLLSRRLADRGIAPHQILMIGDRADNDVLPARAAGWRTCLFTGEWPVLT